MGIPLSCDCGRTFNIKDELAGKKVRCPQCGAALSVPVPVKTADAEEAAGDLLLEDSPRTESAVRPAHWADPEPSPPRPERASPPAPITAHRPKPPPKPAPKPPRQPTRRYSGIAFEEGWFGSLNAGIIGGLLMIGIGVVWLVVGLMLGWIFFYPIILVVVGIGALLKGLASR